jgi:hypothetical protein
MSNTCNLHLFESCELNKEEDGLVFEEDQTNRHGLGYVPMIMKYELNQHGLGYVPMIMN